MKERYLKELKLDDELTSEQFVVLECKKNETKAGEVYYRLELADKSGSISGNVWPDSIANCEPESLKEGVIVKVWGKVEGYKGVNQIKVRSMGVATEYEDGDYLPTSERNVEEMWKGFGEHIKVMEDQNIKSLLTKIFSDEEVKKKYQEHPAATSVHHAFKHGLLEHVMEMLDLSESLMKYYPLANRDLVKAGCILHDIGKLVELVQSGLKYERSKEGLLLGHIILGFQFLSEQAPEDFPSDTLLELKHIILSHHGILEYGSPVVPMTIEAIMVSQLDDASAKTRQYQRIIKNGENSDSEFSDRDFLLGTQVLLKK